MSIKVAQKWFHYLNERFRQLYKNCPKMWVIWANNCCHRLWKIAQSTINRPIWTHCNLSTYQALYLTNALDTRVPLHHLALICREFGYLECHHHQTFEVNVPIGRIFQINQNWKLISTSILLQSVRMRLLLSSNSNNGGTVVVV